MINIKTDYQNHQYVLEYYIGLDRYQECISFFVASDEKFESIMLMIRQKMRDGKINDILK